MKLRPSRTGLRMAAMAFNVWLTRWNERYLAQREEEKRRIREEQDNQRRAGEEKTIRKQFEEWRRNGARAWIETDALTRRARARRSNAPALSTRADHSGDGRRARERKKAQTGKVRRAQVRGGLARDGCAGKEAGAVSGQPTQAISARDRRRARGRRAQDARRDAIRRPKLRVDKREPF
jgi:hypothetical protein